MPPHIIQVTSSVALIFRNSDPTQCFAIKIGGINNPPEACMAPHMFNMRDSQFFEEVKTAEDFGATLFQKARTMLHQKNIQAELLICVIHLLTSGVSLADKREFAGALQELAAEEGYTGALEWLKNHMLECDLPESAVIVEKDILELLPEGIKQLLQEIFIKYRNIDILR